MLKQNKAITLIALVITIVVLLVLAGVAVNLSMGENGILGNAKTAVDRYKQTAENEQIELAKYENEINNISRDIVTIPKDEYYKLLNSSNLTNFSTEEKRVGTWIDGKPLYQRLIITKTPSTSGFNNIFDIPENYEAKMIVARYIFNDDGSIITENFGVARNLDLLT